MLPQPTMPSVLPASSTPMNFDLLPLAGVRRGIGLRDLPGQRHHHRQRVLGGGDRVAEGRVHHDDAARGGGGDVDVVDADAGAPDHLQAVGVAQDVGGDLGRRADGEAVVVADDRLQLVGLEAGLDVDLDAARPKDVGGLRAHAVGDENLGHGVSRYLKR